MTVLNLTSSDDSALSYFEWLCEKIELDRHNGFGPAIRQLYGATFETFIPYDENRAEEGLMLRDRYEAEGFPLPLSVSNRACTVLEMMIALAERMAFEIMDYGDEDLDVAGCFWEMANNLGLKKNHDKNPAVISRFVQRQYQPNGRGGLFPLRSKDEDQRNVEIWYQMHAYLNENY